jgi:hypothetical protein
MPEREVIMTYRRSSKSTVVLPVLLALVLLVIWAVPGNAGWPENGRAVREQAYGQAAPAIAETSDGGAILVWQDHRDGNYDVFAQRIDACGRNLWAADEVVVCNADSAQGGPVIISDEAGGVIVGWIDKRNGDYDIYVQSLNGEGLAAWTPNGVPVVTAEGNQWNVALASDAAGGAFIAWTANGVLVCGASGTQRNPSSVRTPEGVIIAWRDGRTTSYEVYVQKISMSGSPQWDPDGIRIGEGSGDRTDIRMTTDEQGGAILTWSGEQLGSWDIVAQRIGGVGEFPWSEEDIPPTMQDGNQWSNEMVVDGQGGAIACWSDTRSGTSNIYAQRLTRQGHWAFLPPT